MSITLARVDDRIIHGQTTTRWSRVVPVQGILVVSDDVVKDELRKKVLKSAAGNLKLGIYDVKRGVEGVSKGQVSNKNFFLISNSPQYFAKLVELGADFGPTLNVGPMGSREGAKVLGRAVAINDEDYKAFEYMNNQGINIEFQLLPDDEPRTWKTMKAKYDAS